jgi:hypothetical protein
MVRSIIAVVVGYLVFAVSAVALFGLSGVDPHHTAALGFMLGSTLYGIFFAFVGGYLAATIAPRQPRAHAAMLAMVISIGAVGSMVATRTLGWSQLAALFLMAPAATRGGWLRERQTRTVTAR